MIAVDARNLVVRAGGRIVVDGVELQVRTGGWLGLIGPNGAGKTTLLRTLAGGHARESGSVRIGNVDPQRTRPRRLAHHVAVVPQRPVLPPGMPVRDYVLLGRTCHHPALRTESRRDVAVVGQVLHELGLDHLASRAVDTLSGGEAQRVTLARAITQQAPVLLLDEPTAALDVGGQQEVLELVDRLRRDRGLAVIAAMHDLTSAGQFADRLLLMARGRPVARGRVDEVLVEATITRHYGARVRVVHEGDGTVAVVPRRPPVAS